MVVVAGVWAQVLGRRPDYALPFPSQIAVDVAANMFSTVLNAPIERTRLGVLRVL